MKDDVISSGTWFQEACLWNGDRQNLTHDPLQRRNQALKIFLNEKPILNRYDIDIETELHIDAIWNDFNAI